MYGITRSETKAKQLAANEGRFLLSLVAQDKCINLSFSSVFPIVGGPTNTHVWAHLIPTVDVVIEVLGGGPDRPALAHAVLDAIATVAQSTRPSGSPKLSYIFTSDPWVHGASADEFVSDTTPLLNPLPPAVWRAKFEQSLFKDDRVNGIVIRPALLYGKSGSLLAPVFEAAATGGEVGWYGKPGGWFTLAHTDDLADLYLRGAEKAPILGGLAIEGCNDTAESVEGFLQKLIQVSGAKGPYKLLEPSNRALYAIPEG